MKKTDHKKGLIVFFLIATLTTISLPVINIFQHGFQANIKKLFNADSIDQWVSYLNYKIFKRSKYPSKGFVGKNKMLFLGNEFGEVTHKTQGLYEYSPDEIKQWAIQLAELQQWYESKGITFVVVVVPNKHTVYAEHLPFWVEKTRPNLTDDLLSAAHGKNLSVLDLRNPMTEAKVGNQELMYWKTDSHWNHEGAAVGFESTLDYLERIGGIQFKRPEYEVNRSLTHAMGTAWLMRIKEMMGSEAEKLTTLDIKDSQEVCMGDINTDNYQLETCGKASDLTFYIHQGPKYTINDSALNPQKLLLMCDSFVGNVSELYQQSFQTVWVHHYDQLLNNGLIDFVEQNKPDVVVYQIIERNLFKHRYLRNVLNAIKD